MAAAEEWAAAPRVLQTRRWCREAAQRYQQQAEDQQQMEAENLLLDREATKRAIDASNAQIAAADAAKQYYTEMLRLQTLQAELQIELLKKQLGKE